MRALVVFESMYGNTRAIADHVAEGLRPALDASVVPAAEATADAVAEADLLVVGGPTHIHGMSSGRSREAAREAAERPGSGVAFDSAAAEVGIRDWIDGLERSHEGGAAAFDTRIRGPRALTGHASGVIVRRLRDRGFRIVAPPESFLVGKDSHLLDGEAERAAAWGKVLAAATVAGRAAGTTRS